jgi:Chlorophyll A-B binding protein
MQETQGIFDPLGFSTDEASLFRRRAVELKHGRICSEYMIAIMPYNGRANCTDCITEQQRGAVQWLLLNVV